MADPTRLYQIDGILSLAEVGSNGAPGGFEDIGNCMVTLSMAVERVEHREMRTGRRLKDKVLERNQDASFSITAESVQIETLRKFTYGVQQAIPSRTVSQEPLTAYLGKRVKLSAIGLTAFTSLQSQGGNVLTRDTGRPPVTASFDQITDTFSAAAHGLTNGTRVGLSGTLPTGFLSSGFYFVIGASLNDFQLATTFGGTAVTSTVAASSVVVTVQPDYAVDLGTGVITFSSNTTIADGSFVFASYQHAAIEAIEAYQASNRDFALLIEGKNRNENLSPCRLFARRVRFDPLSELQLIGGDEFGQYTVEGQILFDATTGDFFRYEQLPVA
ncbi:MAG: hypothetical protein DDT26_00101 [Dehalococcoidia bacterium]|nr:hypothetical protein [Chloroflexota bacterium]